MSSKDDFWKTQLSEWTTLERPERISEALFGLIMVLTFTCTISVSQAGRQEVRVLLFAGGYSLGRYSGLKPIRTALSCTAVGVFLVALTIALGG